MDNDDFINEYCKFWMVDLDEDEINEVCIYYESGGVLICHEYDQIMSQYSQEKVTQYDFTIKNILKYIP